MKIPNADQAIVPSRKLTHYLLSATHRDGQHKAAFFRSFGFTLDEWERLASALLLHVRSSDVSEVVPTPFGQNYVVEGPLPSPDGRSPSVRAVWFVAKDAEAATFATAYPLDT